MPLNLDDVVKPHERAVRVDVAPSGDVGMGGPEVEAFGRDCRACANRRADEAPDARAMLDVTRRVEHGERPGARLEIAGQRERDQGSGDVPPAQILERPFDVGVLGHVDCTQDVPEA